MKNIIKSIVLFSLIITGLYSCKKEENKVYFEEGKNPVLSTTFTGTYVPMAFANLNQEAVKLSWTNPDYMFNTGVSSQNVTYSLEIDTAGANFKYPKKKVVVFASELGVSITQGELNDYLLNQMELAVEVSHNIEMRIVASINGSAATKKVSNVIAFKVTPFKIPPKITLPASGAIYITGSATPENWTNSPSNAQKCTKESETVYSIVMSFQPGLQYKFLSELGKWQPQYGGESATGGDIGVNYGNGSDPKEIPTPAEAGTYKVTLNLQTGKYSVVKQ